MLDSPSRKLWIAALVVSVICVAGLVYALVSDWNTEPQHPLARRAEASSGGSGFGLGVMVGLGAGVVIGSLIALRKRD